jgi:hypothetical protein
VFFFLKVLLGIGQFGILGAWWKIRRLQRLRVIIVLSLRLCCHFFFLGYIFVVAPTFF